MSASVSSQEFSTQDKDGQNITRVDTREFQYFIGSVIFLNVLALAAETDHPDWPIWLWVDNFFLIVFVIELVLRFWYKGLGFITSSPAWAFLDIVLVIIGVLDEWLMPLMPVQEGGGGPGQQDHAQTSMLRSLRMLRLLRLLRMFKMFPNLNAFLNAQQEMMKTVVWIFFVLFIVILCCSILLTHLLGHRTVNYLQEMGQPDELVEAPDPDVQARLHAWRRVQADFKDVPTAFFTLFQVTTTDNWDRIATPLVTINPLWRIFFVIFIVFMAWTMISILTAVASDSMIDATTNRKEQEIKEAEQKQRQFMIFLRERFYEADTDGNGVLDFNEFQAMMQKEFLQQQMKKSGVHLSDEELKDAWHILDIEGTGELTIEHFVEGLAYLQERLSAIHVVNVDYNLKRTSARMHKKLAMVVGYLEELKRQNEQLAQWAREQKAMQQQEVVLMWLWQRWAEKRDKTALHGMARIRSDELPPELQKFEEI